MPKPETYEKEYQYWPWGRLLAEAVESVAAHAPPSAFIVDFMCGTGFLLSKVVSKRRDISAVGCDNSKAYLDYAQRMYPNVTFVRDDARSYEPPQRIDLVICTAGVHHLRREDQPAFIEKISRELPGDGYFILGEEVIGAYRNELERKQMLLEMFTELMCFLNKLDAPEEVVEAAADMLVNEWCARGEYKTSRSELEIMLDPYFRIIAARQIWPEKTSEFGDWLFVCQKK
jgi:cyclopropane fatty-acyl-phospholipid synthase-like methyltransferase